MRWTAAPDRLANEPTTMTAPYNGGDLGVHGQIFIPNFK